MYPVLSDEITRLKRQPLLSEFQVIFNGRVIPICVNETAENIMLLCNGINDQDEICKTLSLKYNEDIDVVSNYVTNFLKDAINYKHVELQKTKLEEPRSLNIYGSREYWTPKVVVIELTNKCPLNCRHCYVDKSNPIIMPNIMAEDIINQVVKLQIEEVQITGGEPLLHPSFNNIISSLISSGVFVHLFTSGYIENKQVIEKLLKLNKKSIIVQVSLDGLKEYHDNFRQKKGCFDSSIEFLKILNNNGFKTIVGTTIKDQPYGELAELCKICKDIGVAGIRIGAISSRGEAIKNSLLRTDEETGYVRDILKRLSVNENTDTFKVLLTEVDIVNNDSPYAKNCGIGQNILKISPTGDVFPCIMSDLKIGNISKYSIETILKDTSRIFEKIENPSHSICAECEKEILCGECIIEGLYYKDITSTCKWNEKSQNLIQEIINKFN